MNLVASRGVFAFFDPLDCLEFIDPMDIKQHDIEIHENLHSWNAKPLLRAVYKEFYSKITAELDGLVDGVVLECGSGVGNLKSAIPHCITSDLFPNPWLDRIENVYDLSFEDSSISAVILFDVFHHLEFPGNALAEIHRVLRPGGRLVIFEPAMGVLGRVILGCFHHEPLGLRQPIMWLPADGFDPWKQRYYAAQGNAWRIFRRGETGDLSSWAHCSVRYYPAVPYILSGGFRGPCILPRWAWPLAWLVERGLGIAPRLFASRMLVVLEKK